MQNSKLKLM